MKIAICEDSEQDLELFKNLCSTYIINNKKQIQITSFSSGEKFLKDYYPKKYDAIFLDIYMKDLTGIATAKKIRAIDESVKIIFTTTSSDHYSEGFEVEATHYIIKPLNQEKFEQAMHRLRNLFIKNEKMLVLLNGNKSVEIPQSSIMYIETIRNGIEVHCKHEVFSVRTPLLKAIEQLTDKCFLQCHRYCVINLKEVICISDCAFLMSDGRKILIRKTNQKEIEQAYHSYKIEQLRGD